MQDTPFNFDGGMIRLDNGGGAAKTTNSYADGLWHHVVAIKPNNGNIANLVLCRWFWLPLGMVRVATFNIGETANFSIGADKANNRINFIGTIDDFRLYNKELNATAVSAMYASGAGEGYYTPTLPVQWI